MESILPTEEYMDKVNAKLGTDYKPFNYYGAPDAEHVIVAMGSACDTIKETVDYLVANGEKVGFGEGKTKKAAEQKAAYEAILAIRKSEVSN